jgi:micrococcal nuclease
MRLPCADSHVSDYFESAPMPSRIQRKRWPQVVTSLLALLVFVVGWWWEEGFLQQPGGQQPQVPLTAGDYLVQRVVDGDTLILEQNQLRVRLQGIDTPETVERDRPIEPWGPEASAYTQNFLEAAQWQVRLEIDGEPVDRYGRHLAFIWHAGRLLNEELVSQGLAHAKTRFDFSEPMKARLRKAQSTARAAGRGIWSGP